jgi:hypothetical protein
MAQPTPANPQPAEAKKGRSLLKPEHKTAIRDFVVSIAITPRHQAPPVLTFASQSFSAYLFLLNMDRPIGPRGLRAGLTRDRSHHADHEHHLW